MPTRQPRILAIDPGTRKIGVAVLENGALTYHGVKVLRNRRAPQEKLREARKVLLGLIRDFRPRVVAVEKAFFANNRNAALLNVLVDEIRAVARSKGLEVMSYAPSTVKKYICGNGRASKKEVARAMVARYPELSVYFSQDRQWKERHHQNMFDAVALGTMAARRART